MILASLTASGSAGNAERTQGIVSRVLFVVGCAFLCLWVLILGATLLPDAKSVLFLLGFLAIIVIVAHKRFNRFYSAAETLLVETLASDAGRVNPDVDELLSLISEAELGQHDVSSSDFAAGRLIRELHLRSKTGAVIVVIARGKDRIISPGPDEEILAGDSLLLVGDGNSLRRAHDVLTSNSSGLSWVQP